MQTQNLTLDFSLNIYMELSCSAASVSMTQHLLPLTTLRSSATFLLVVVESDSQEEPL